jgi:hypothetical protein
MREDVWEKSGSDTGNEATDILKLDVREMGGNTEMK